MYHLRIALRRLGRQKLQTTLHITGLTLGMSVCLLIGLFLRYELSFDGYHANAACTYRVNHIWTDAGMKEPNYSTPFPLAGLLRNDFPEFEHVTQVHHPQGDPVIEINPQKRFAQEHVMMTDPEFLNVFDVQVLEGNAYEALRYPYQALLTESAATKFFGREDPLGKTFKYRNDYTITVAGLIRDFPGNTHLPASVILSLCDNEKFLETSLTQMGFTSGGSTFVVLPEGLDPNSLNARLKALYDRTINADANLPTGLRSDMVLQPLRAIHLDPTFEGGGEWVSAINPTWLWFFGAVGLAVLLLACINFVNLSTAQALVRAKEVGVRKSVGAGRGQLIGQFLGEAWLLALIAGAFSVLIAQGALPWLNELTGKQITFQLLQEPALLGGLLAGIAGTGLLAGLYPAWVIARYNPVATLKTGASAGDKRSAGLRKGLVVVQFSISVGLLIALLLIARQMDYLRSKNLGFNKDNSIVVKLPNRKARAAFTNELARINGVGDFSLCTAPPCSDGHWRTLMSRIGRDDPQRQPVTLILADERYCTMYGIQPIAGRLLTAADTNLVATAVPEEKQHPNLVVNQALVKALGFASPAAALGQRFWFGHNGWTGEIVGVVRDFNTSSLHEAIQPALITPSAPEYEQVGIKIRAGANVPATIAAIESAWKGAFPIGLFDYSFLDQDIDAFYKAEERLFALFRIFAGLAMLISCLGLWGLATFAAEQRTREIGIRKVLGASVEGIVGLLSREFLLLVAVAIAIAVPLAWYGMGKWLEDFAFRIDMGWQEFALAGVIALLVAFGTVSFQSFRAALANPVRSLRSE